MWTVGTPALTIDSSFQFLQGRGGGLAYGSFGASHSTGIGNRRELSTPDPKLILRSPPLDSPLSVRGFTKPVGTGPV